MEYIKLNNIYKKTEKKYQTVTLDNGTEILCLDYLPLAEKQELANLILQNSWEEGGYYSPIKVDMYFELYTLYTYTNIDFSQEEKDNPYDTYDKAKKIFEAIYDQVDDISELSRYVYTLDKKVTKANLSLAAVLQNTIENAPEKMREAAEIINTFDPEKYQAVIKFAEAANGNRPIS